jgi:hypothetical protein
MCLACEQDAMWLAYLDSQGLLNPDDPKAVAELFAAFPEQPLPMQSGLEPKPRLTFDAPGEVASPSFDATKPAPKPASKSAAKPDSNNPFVCDAPPSE